MILTLENEKLETSLKGRAWRNSMRRRWKLVGTLGRKCEIVSRVDGACNEAYRLLAVTIEEEISLVGGDWLLHCKSQATGIRVRAWTIQKRRGRIVLDEEERKEREADRLYRLIREVGRPTVKKQRRRERRTKEGEVTGERATKRHDSSRSGSRWSLDFALPSPNGDERAEMPRSQSQQLFRARLSSTFLSGRDRHTFHRLLSLFWSVYRRLQDITWFYTVITFILAPLSSSLTERRYDDQHLRSDMIPCGSFAGIL